MNAYEQSQRVAERAILKRIAGIQGDSELSNLQLAELVEAEVNYLRRQVEAEVNALRQQGEFAAILREAYELTAILREQGAVAGRMDQ